MAGNRLKHDHEPPAPDNFGDHLVFVDESGDHGLAAVNQDFPLFALAFCVFPKAAYVNKVTPELRRLKPATFGHDLVVLHEHDIRKKAGAFAMMSRAPREAFLDALSRVIEAAPFALVVVVIDKRGLRLEDAATANPYHLALQFGLERVFRLLAERGQAARITHFIVESRGKREDTELELEFRRICEGGNGLGRALPKLRRIGRPRGLGRRTARLLTTRWPNTAAPLDLKHSTNPWPAPKSLRTTLPH